MLTKEEYMGLYNRKGLAQLLVQKSDRIKELERTIKEVKEITLAVLAIPQLHYRSCYEDVSGRPVKLDCRCPIKKIVEMIHKLKEE